MAAYAAVTSLMGTIHLISQSSLDLQEGHKEHLKLLYDKVSSLLEFLDNSDDEPTKNLQKKVKDVAQEVEDNVESHILKIIQRATKIFHLPTKDNKRVLKMLRRAIRDLDLMKEKLIKLQAGNCSPGRSSSPRLQVSALDSDMVGYHIEQDLMRNQLTGHSSQLEVISIVGMGGIGKSTFAKKMYSDPSIVNFFDVRGWITVSEDYSLRKILLSLLRDAIGVKLEELDQKPDGELADRLQKSLKGRRYLIVLDDIWSTEAWDDIKLCFPEYNNKSRVLLTTRDMKVAECASSPKDPFPMRVLDPEESWKLYCQKAFGKNDCPFEFENVAKEVLKNCKGLPLVISVVAGTLSSKSTLDEWRKVAQSVNSLVNLDDYQHCSGVLALSYSHLPSHLKACFLYFGVFPKAREISVKKLIRLWAAEGLILELKGLEALEKHAANLLHDLIDKSLVDVSKRSYDGKVKSCRIHDLLHDLCLREAKSDNLLYAVNPPVSRRPARVCPQGRRWVSVHLHAFYPNIDFHDLTDRTRSLHISSNAIMDARHLSGLDHFKLLRVLDLETVILGVVPSEISLLASLRYLAVMVLITKDMPISNLLNLQTFIFTQYMPAFSGTIYIPDVIWEMSQLRHLQFTSMYLYPPKVPADEAKYRVLENLQSVSGLSPSCCTKEIFERIQKVKKLGIYGKDEFRSEPRCLDNLTYLRELEVLSIESYSFQRDGFLRLPCLGSLPPNLKKLSFYRTFLLWEDMTIISKLPKLEVLLLKEDAFEKTTAWEVTEMGFPELRFLLLEELNLEYWRATDDYFPRIERIVIINCRYLKEIPKGFADCMTLQQIKLYRCNPSLVTSAEQIQESQQCFGNCMFKVYAFDTKESESDSDEEDKESAEGDMENVHQIYSGTEFDQMKFIKKQQREMWRELTRF